MTLKGLTTIGLLLIWHTSQAHVLLTSPVGGEAYAYNQSVTITWQIQVAHTTENWDLYYSTDGGTNWNPLSIDLSAGALSYNWTVPSVTTNQARIKVIQDNVDYDYEDISGDFSISATVSILPKLTENSLSISPNPFNDEAVLTFGYEELNTEINIMNSSGQLVKTIFTHNNKNIPLKKEGFSEGIYYYIIRNEKKVLNGKFVVY